MSFLSTTINRAKMVGSYFLPRTKMRPYPQEVVIELTNHCNLACMMCPQQTLKRPRGFMDENLFRKIIDELKGKTELIYLYGTGESLLHKKLPDYTRYASQQGLKTCLSTNGMLMDETASRKLLDCNLDFLIVALDGGTKETYERVRIKGNFEKLIRNIKTLLKLKQKLQSPTHVCLQMIYMPQNSNEVEEFLGLFNSEEKKIVNQFRIKPLYETYAIKNNPIKHTRPCFWLWNMMSIYWNGDVALCCMDADNTYYFGSVKEKSIAEMWNSQQLINLRKKHRHLDYDDMPLCATCDIPEQGYFHWTTILGSMLINASIVRRLLPIYEKYVILLLRKRS